MVAFVFLYVDVMVEKCLGYGICLFPFPSAPLRMCGLKCIEVNGIRLIFLEDGIVIVLVHSDLPVS